MSKQHTRRQRRRCAVVRVLAVGGAAAALVAILGAGQALASTAPPDERVLERQGRIGHQSDEQARVEESSQQAPPTFPRRWIRPEPNMDPGPWIDDQPLAPAPPPAPDDAGPGLAIPAAVAVVVLALGVATTWWVRHRRASPELTT
jgi:hypothetical protein